MTKARRKMKAAILISGRGSNMTALLEASRDPEYPVEFVSVISNRPNAGGLKHAKEHGIATEILDHETFDRREDFEAVLNHHLQECAVDLICLAGFMRILNADFVRRWRDRLINIHPSLLPAYKGLHTHERALEDGVRFTGCTVHFVRPEMDAGPIIMQAVVPVNFDDTEATLSARVLQAEHQIYPEAVRLIGEGRVRVSGNKVKISNPAAIDGLLTNPVIGA